MSKPIIEVHDLSKKYRYGQNVQPYYTLRDTLSGILRSPKHLLPKTKEEKNKNEFWALKNVSFEVKEGEVLGVIGPNGSGKSTLLKILSRITPPTKGKAILRGRVGSLLEVGTGFHQELTGRENIYLNGAILGMSRREIKKKYDEIVDFSGVEKFLDTPVKRYSSGMMVRLGFAVAAYLEPEILLIDEVLAVGDAEFQKKCLKKMDDIARGGRTIIFVSHNMIAVKNITNNCLVLNEGKVYFQGKTGKATEMYRKLYDTHPLEKTNKLAVNEYFTIEEVKCNYIASDDMQNDLLKINFKYGSKNSFDLCVSYAIRNYTDDKPVVYTHNHLENVKLMAKRRGNVSTSILLPKLAPGNYSVESQVWADGALIFGPSRVSSFEVLSRSPFPKGDIIDSYPSIIMARSEWSIS